MLFEYSMNAGENVFLENNGEIISSNEQYVTYVLKTNDVSYGNMFGQFFLPKKR